jgi:CRP/FNR family transcriptional regulator, cyclic AMP receptor protein
MTDPTLVEALRRSRLGTELSEEQTHTLAESLSFRDLKPGEVLVPEGTSDNHLYVIVSGALGVVRRGGSADAVTLLTLTNGDLVGELSFIDETPHYASLVSIGPTRVFSLERQKLESLLLTRPEIVYRVMRAIVRTVHEIQRRISMQSAELTNYIYKQHGKY